jgi:hypothetical protein
MTQASGGVRRREKVRKIAIGRPVGGSARAQTSTDAPQRSLLPGYGAPTVRRHRQRRVRFRDYRGLRKSTRSQTMRKRRAAGPARSLPPAPTRDPEQIEREQASGTRCPHRRIPETSLLGPDDGRSASTHLERFSSDRPKLRLRSTVRRRSGLLVHDQPLKRPVNHTAARDRVRDPRPLPSI